MRRSRHRERPIWKSIQRNGPQHNGEYFSVVGPYNQCKESETLVHHAADREGIIFIFPGFGPRQPGYFVIEPEPGHKHIYGIDFGRRPHVGIHADVPIKMSRRFVRSIQKCRPHGKSVIIGPVAIILPAFRRFQNFPRLISAAGGINKNPPFQGIGQMPPFRANTADLFCPRT